jgi:membrane-bound ClpP family serine protease
MARNTDSPRRLKGYYGFSKKYPSRRGERPIHESRRTKKRERTKFILFCVALCCLFVSTFIIAKVCYNLSTRPLPNENLTETPSVVTVDSLNSLRAIYLENSILDDTADFDAALKSAAENGFNAIMLDFKTQEGVLTYNSKLISYNGDTQYNEINQTVINKIKNEGFICSK